MFKDTKELRNPEAWVGGQQKRKAVFLFRKRTVFLNIKKKRKERRKEKSQVLFLLVNHQVTFLLEETHTHHRSVP
jgi:hypothetical protein